jgi:hypothetical protein
MRPGLRRSAGRDGAATAAKSLAASPEGRNAAICQVVQLTTVDEMHLLIENGDGSAFALTRTMCLRLLLRMTAQDSSAPTDGLDDTYTALALQYSYMRFTCRVYEHSDSLQASCMMLSVYLPDL